MPPVLLAVALAVAWTAMSGAVTFVNLAFGFVLGSLALALVRDSSGLSASARRAFHAVVLALVFLVELIKSTRDVVVIVITGRPLSPAIVAYPLTVTRDSEIVLLANLITLTPGTLSLDVSTDRRVLYVHAIDAPDPDAVIAGIRASFETRVAKVFA